MMAASELVEPAGSDTSQFTLVIADDDPRVRLALSDLCNDHPHLVVVATAGNGTDAAELCRVHQPDLAIVDIVMPAGGAEAVIAIHAASPLTTVVAFTARNSSRTRDRMLLSGAAEVFIKGTDLDLADALHRIASSDQP